MQRNREAEAPDTMLLCCPSQGGCGGGRLPAGFPQARRGTRSPAIRPGRRRTLPSARSRCNSRQVWHGVDAARSRAQCWRHRVIAGRRAGPRGRSVRVGTPCDGCASWPVVPGGSCCCADPQRSHALAGCQPQPAQTAELVRLARARCAAPAQTPEGLAAARQISGMCMSLLGTGMTTGRA